MEKWRGILCRKQPHGFCSCQEHIASLGATIYGQEGARDASRMTRELIRFCRGRPIGPAIPLWWVAVTCACSLNPQPLPPGPGANTFTGNPSPPFEAPDGSVPAKEPSSSSGSSSDSSSASSSGSSSGSGRILLDAGAMGGDAASDGGGAGDSASANDSEAGDSASTCDVSSCADGASIGDGGSFGCTADPAGNAMCTGGNPPHFYRCVVPYMQPAACQTLSIGNAKDTYCCP